MGVPFFVFRTLAATSSNILAFSFAIFPQSPRPSLLATTESVLRPLEPRLPQRSLGVGHGGNHGRPNKRDASGLRDLYLLEMAAVDEPKGSGSRWHLPKSQQYGKFWYKNLLLHFGPWVHGCEILRKLFRTGGWKVFLRFSFGTHVQNMLHLIFPQMQVFDR